MGSCQNACTSSSACRKNVVKRTSVILYVSLPHTIQTSNTTVGIKQVADGLMYVNVNVFYAFKVHTYIRKVSQVTIKTTIGRVMFTDQI